MVKFWKGSFPKFAFPKFAERSLFWKPFQNSVVDILRCRPPSTARYSRGRGSAPPLLRSRCVRCPSASPGSADAGSADAEPGDPVLLTCLAVAEYIGVEWLQMLGGRCLSYGEMASMAGGAAMRLRAAGVAPEMVVAVCVDEVQKPTASPPARALSEPIMGQISLE